MCWCGSNTIQKLDINTRKTQPHRRLLGVYHSQNKSLQQISCSNALRSLPQANRICQLPRRKKLLRLYAPSVATGALTAGSFFENRRPPSYATGEHFKWDINIGPGLTPASSLLWQNEWWQCRQEWILEDCGHNAAVLDSAIVTRIHCPRHRHL